MPIGAVRAAILGIKKGIQGILVGPTQITTSTASTATAYSNQRKIDRTSNGVLWAICKSTTEVVATPGLAYSTDNGATWNVAPTADWGNPGGSTAIRFDSGAIFIDLDDYAHVVYKNSNDGGIYYRRGTPNAGRTAWTWSGTTTLYSSATTYNYPDIVAHREGTGWKVHVVCAEGTNGNMNRWRLNVTSGGTVTADENNILTGTGYAGSAASFPSIDFNHTGDGKTVAGGTPHLYVAWSAGATGAGKGIRFKKATYSGGSWTWGTEREIDSTLYVYAGSTEMSLLNCLFDGTRVVVAGYLYNGSSRLLCVWDRDVADTSTTAHPKLALDTVGDRFWSGSATYDGTGNLYLWGITQDASRRLVHRKWTRSGTSFGAAVEIDATGTPNWVSAKRGYSNNRIEFVYTDGTASPYSVTYGGIK